MLSSRVAHLINLSLAFLFASGALLTTSIVHIIPEAMQGLEGEILDDFHGLLQRSGIVVMSGVFGGFLLHVALSHGHSHAPSKSNTATHSTADSDNTISTTTENSLDDTLAGHSSAQNAASAKGDEVPAVSVNDHGSVTSRQRTPEMIAMDSRDPSKNGAVRDEIEEGGQYVAMSLNGAHESPAGVDLAQAGLGTLNLYDLKSAGNDRGLFDLRGLNPVCWNVILGDLTHNFADGITMGAAFLGCSPTVGWTVTAANMMHEIPHELANFMALVNGGMTVSQVRTQFEVQG